jgi:hypothetical protein
MDDGYTSVSSLCRTIVVVFSSCMSVPVPMKCVDVQNKSALCRSLPNNADWVNAFCWHGSYFGARVVSFALPTIKRHSKVNYSIVPHPAGQTLFQKRKARGRTEHEFDWIARIVLRD